MNARLLEIVKQSGLLKILTEHAGEFGTGTFIDTPYPEVEKFAELVIAAYTPPPHPIYLASDGRFYDIPQRQKPLTEDELETAYRKIWRNLPEDFNYGAYGWIETGIRYAEKAHGIL
jgi:hypothetical protein